jgi:predicted RNA-binding protein with PIN domain
MAYLVDGNNVMAQRVGWHKDKRRARRTTMDELANFAARKQTRITVVFDGAPEEHFPDGSTYRGIKLHYAARGSNADERIKSIVEAMRERRSLRVAVIRSGDFRKLMEDVSGEDSAAAREEKREVQPDDTAHWLRYFGVAAGDDE